MEKSISLKIIILGDTAQIARDFVWETYGRPCFQQNPFIETHNALFYSTEVERGKFTLRLQIWFIYQSPLKQFTWEQKDRFMVKADGVIFLFEKHEPDISLRVEYWKHEFLKYHQEISSFSNFPHLIVVNQDDDRDIPDEYSIQIGSVIRTSIVKNKNTHEVFEVLANQILNYQDLN